MYLEVCGGEVQVKESSIMSLFANGLGPCGVLSAMAISATVTAETITIGVGSYYYDVQFAPVQVGDTIRWVWEGGTHDVTSGSSCTDDSGIFYGPVTSSQQSYEWTVTAAYDGQVIPYYCSVGNHCVAGNQYGGLMVNVGEVHFVTTDGFTFVPNNIEVNAGDVVVWIHAGGSHTVTSGVQCTPDGLFDEPLDNFAQMPFYVVPPDASSGIIDYFCAPHCGMGMDGTITVIGSGNECPEDIDGNGAVGVDDLLQLLAVFGSSCPGCGEDIDGNGAVGVDDLLALLAVYGQDC